MKKYIIAPACVIALVLLTVQSIQAQSYTTSMNDVRMTPDGPRPTMRLYSENTFADSSRWVYTMFVFMRNIYSEAYAGVSYKITPRFIVGVAGGLESTSTYWRAEVSAALIGARKGSFTDRLTISGCYERGADINGYGYGGSAFYSSPRWDVGFYGLRTYGVGPWARYRVPHSKLSLSGSPFYDPEGTNHKPLLGSLLKPTVFLQWDF